MPKLRNADFNISACRSAFCQEAVYSIKNQYGSSHGEDGGWVGPGYVVFHDKAKTMKIHDLLTHRMQA